MVFGLFFMAFPIAIIGSKVTAEYENMAIRNKEKAIQKRREAAVRRVSGLAKVSMRVIKNLNPVSKNGAIDASRSDTKEFAELASDTRRAGEIPESGENAVRDNHTELCAILQDISALKLRLEALCKKS